MKKADALLDVPATCRQHRSTPVSFLISPLRLWGYHAGLGEAEWPLPSRNYCSTGKLSLVPALSAARLSSFEGVGPVSARAVDLDPEAMHNRGTLNTVPVTQASKGLKCSAVAAMVGQPVTLAIQPFVTAWVTL